MTLDSTISLRDILEWLHTPIGRLIVQGALVFIVCEAVKLFAEKWLDVQTKWKREKVIVYAELISYICHIVFGFGVATCIFYDGGWGVILGNSWWIIVSSIFIHVAYSNYLKKMINKKIKGDK